MKTNFTLIFFLALFQVTAQDLVLHYSNRTKTMKAGTFIRIETPSTGQEPCVKCSTNFITGKLISAANGSIQIHPRMTSQPVVQNGLVTRVNEVSYLDTASSPLISIPVDQIYSIAEQGNKKLREKTTGEVMGFILMTLGASHLLSAPVVELTEGNDSKTLLFLGLGEFAAGLVTSQLFKHKTFITHTACPERKDSDRVWNFQSFP
jgi:hypothetical protein